MTNQLYFFLHFYTKIKSKHRVYSSQLTLIKFPNLHIVWTAGKNLALPDTISRNTPPELLTRRTTVEVPQINEFYLEKKIKYHQDWNVNMH